MGFPEVSRCIALRRKVGTEQGGRPDSRTGLQVMLAVLMLEVEIG